MRRRLAVEADGAALQHGHVGVGVQGVEAPRRVPSRAGGRLGTFEEHDVAPARPGEAVEHAASHHPATATRTWDGMATSPPFGRLGRRRSLAAYNAVYRHRMAGPDYAQSSACRSGVDGSPGTGPAKARHSPSSSRKRESRDLQSKWIPAPASARTCFRGNDGLKEAFQ